MYGGIVTDIEIDIQNNSADTLFLFHGSAKVSSRNIAYQYNDMFLPLPNFTMAPGKSETVKLTGKERTSDNNWLEIAGEQLTVTLRGLLLGNKELSPLSVSFVPENPMMER